MSYHQIRNTQKIPFWQELYVRDLLTDAEKGCIKEEQITGIANLVLMQYNDDQLNGFLKKKTHMYKLQFDFSRANIAHVVAPVLQISEEWHFWKSSIISFSLPEITEMTTVRFWDCPKLTTVNMPKLRKITTLTFREAGKFYRSPSLSPIKELNFPGLEYTFISEFNDMPMLETLSLPKLSEFGHVIVMRNPKLTKIDLGTWKKPGKLEIVHNPELKTLNWEKANGLTQKMTKLVVRYNKYLDRATLDKLAGLCESNCDIQRPQKAKECLLNKTIDNLKELDGCEAVFGNLSLSSSVEGTISSKISHIDGNLKIENTGLMSVDFLRGANITGKATVKGNICVKDPQNPVSFTDVDGTKTVKVENVCPTTTTSTTTASTTTKVRAEAAMNSRTNKDKAYTDVWVSVVIAIFYWMA